MARIRPANIRQTANKLNYPIIGISHYYFNYQFKQVLALQQAISKVGRVLDYPIAKEIIKHRTKVKFEQLQPSIYPIFSSLRSQKFLALKRVKGSHWFRLKKLSFAGIWHQGEFSFFDNLNGVRSKISTNLGKTPLNTPVNALVRLIIGNSEMYLSDRHSKKELPQTQHKHFPMLKLNRLKQINSLFQLSKLGYRQRPSSKVLCNRLALALCGGFIYKKSYNEKKNHLSFYKNSFLEKEKGKSKQKVYNFNFLRQVVFSKVFQSLEFNGFRKISYSTLELNKNKIGDQWTCLSARDYHVFESLRSVKRLRARQKKMKLKKAEIIPIHSPYKLVKTAEVFKYKTKNVKIGFTKGVDLNRIEKTDLRYSHLNPCFAVAYSHQEPIRLNLFTFLVGSLPIDYRMFPGIQKTGDKTFRQVFI